MKFGKTSPWAIFGVIIFTFFTSVGQLFWKMGADNLIISFLGLLTNWDIILGFVFYGVGTLIMIYSLRNGELSVLYPFIALSFIWVSFISSGYLGESISILNWIGVASIIGGVSFIGWGAEQ